ncbi:hypothetical protein, partial [Arthrobacter sp. ES1]
MDHDHHNGPSARQDEPGAPRSGAAVAHAPDAHAVHSQGMDDEHMVHTQGQHAGHSVAMFKNRF